MRANASSYIDLLTTLNTTMMSTNSDNVEVLTLNGTEFNTAEGTAAVVEAITWLGNYTEALPALSGDIGLNLAAQE